MSYNCCDVLNSYFERVNIPTGSWCLGSLSYDQKVMNYHELIFILLVRDNEVLLHTLWCSFISEHQQWSTLAILNCFFSSYFWLRIRGRWRAGNGGVQWSLSGMEFKVHHRGGGGWEVDTELKIQFNSALLEWNMWQLLPPSNCLQINTFSGSKNIHRLVLIGRNWFVETKTSVKKLTNIQVKILLMFCNKQMLIQYFQFFHS